MAAAALVFFISGQHVLWQEALWRQWTEEVGCHIFVHYTDASRITSTWLRQHMIPQSATRPTSYYDMVPAMMSALSYAHQSSNAQWFCLLTEACIPVASPTRFKEMATDPQIGGKTLMHWQPAWWNTAFHRRANLRLLPAGLRLGHDPWFILGREDVYVCLDGFYRRSPRLCALICRGGLANESIFAVLLRLGGRLDGVLNERTTATDWSRMSSATSPHVFGRGDEADCAEFLRRFRTTNAHTMFLRKVDGGFQARTALLAFNM